jgi:hypothetical protein
MIIGLHGKARSGKDTFGEYLIEHLDRKHHRHFQHMSFATQLKQMCKDHFELSDDQLWERGKNIRETPDKRFPCPDRQGIPPYCLGNRDDGKGLEHMEERKYWSPREIMQELGSFYRKINYDYWVMALAIESVRRGYKDVIITDVRHVNECEYVKVNKGMLVKIVKPEAQDIHNMHHESEIALDDRPDEYFDIIIDNSGTLDDLRKASENAASAIITIEKMINKGEVYNG